jgi:hypothetical protein
MKRFSLAIVVCLLVPIFAGAKQPVYQTGTIVSMNSVRCGSRGKRHKSTLELLCHEYVIRTDSLEYHIRQQGDEHTDLLPVGQQAEFRLVKDVMRLRVSEQDGKTSKEHAYLVVSVDQRSDGSSGAQ